MKRAERLQKSENARRKRSVLKALKEELLERRFARARRARRKKKK